MKRIAYYDLEIGMKLAKDLFDPSAQNLLICKGTVVNNKILRKISNLKIYDIYIEDTREEKLYAQAEEIYGQAHKEIINVFNEIRSGGVVNITPVEKCMNDIVKQVLDHDEILTKLILIKSIDNYTSIHSINVCIYSLLLGHLLGWDRKKLVLLGIGALLHDVGKAFVPEAILIKPGKLNEEEMNEIKQHPVLGCQALAKNQEIYPDVLRMVCEHHERLDGSGYPEGKKDRDILIESKIIAIADVFDAVSSERVYRKAMPPHEGVEVLMGWGSVKQLDPVLIQIFLENITVYPIGTLVELTNGEVGKVVHIPRSLPTRPTVQTSSTGEIVSLLENTTIFIKRIIFSGFRKGKASFLTEQESKVTF